MKWVMMVFILAIFLASCSKSGKNNKGCGCSTDSVVQIFVNKYGTIFFDSANYTTSFDGGQFPRGWYINIPLDSNSTFHAYCLVCNPNLTTFKRLSDTMKNPSNESEVYVSGKITNLCSDENCGIHLPELLPYHIIIDSIKKY